MRTLKNKKRTVRTSRFSKARYDEIMQQINKDIANTNKSKSTNDPFNLGVNKSAVKKTDAMEQFEQEYEAFIADLKKKAEEKKKDEEVNEDVEPVVETEIETKEEERTEDDKIEEVVDPTTGESPFIPEKVIEESVEEIESEPVTGVHSEDVPSKPRKRKKKIDE